MLSVFRIVVGLMFLEHGTQKLIGIPPMPMPGYHFDPTTMLGAAALIETIGGIAIILGFLTRPVAFILAGEMAVAYFTQHFPRAFSPIVNQGEPAVYYCFTFLYLMFAGGGPWSIDAILARSRHHTDDERRSSLPPGGNDVEDRRPDAVRRGHSTVGSH